MLKVLTLASSNDPSFRNYRSATLWIILNRSEVQQLVKDASGLVVRLGNEFNRSCLRPSFTEVAANLSVQRNSTWANSKYLYIPYTNELRMKVIFTLFFQFLISLSYSLDEEMIIK